jgi:large subunit ribosomal protein L21
MEKRDTCPDAWRSQERRGATQSREIPATTRLTEGRPDRILQRFSSPGMVWATGGESLRSTVMDPYAVVETGGKQYRVSVGESFSVESLDGKEGDKITLDKVLAVSDGKTLKIGAPTLAGAHLVVEVVKQTRGPKVVSFVKRRRKGSQKKIGHRQEQTILKLIEISAN